MGTIRDRTVVITGAARGIGFATAEALLRRGARVVIGDRDIALGESAVARLTNLGPVSGYPSTSPTRNPSRHSSTRPAATGADTSTC